MRTLLPEGQRVYLREHSTTELLLSALNEILERHELMIHITKVRNPKRVVASTDKDGKSEKVGISDQDA